ncbi:MAG: hypothetical protein J6M64_01205 [Oscillospiraceae bacterium]|nr:hypothetical protein [Oscillospiraceae bacterium]
MDARQQEHFHVIHQNLRVHAYQSISARNCQLFFSRRFTMYDSPDLDTAFFDTMELASGRR